MEKLTIELKNNKYDILFGGRFIRRIGELIGKLLTEQTSVAVVTDENVWAIYEEMFSFGMKGIDFKPIIMPPGEDNKSFNGLTCLYDSFARIKLTRGGLIVVFGGGVVGDLCGFAAATWMRGVRLVQIPTTLLAQVDSSVGGKTAINMPQGKNLVGTFYQPSLVIIDPETLRTLPDREWRCGMAEVVKYGAIRSPNLFDVLDGDAKLDLSSIIRECCRIKSEIVSRDENDLGERMLLNFGHTFGHAIEKSDGLGKYTHGEAVAFGMVMAAGIGESLGVTESGTKNALRRVLARCGLETEYPGDVMRLIQIMAYDKKSGDGWVRLVLLERIGKALIHRTEFSELETLMKTAL
jgi:3-dehydroquinate synthase